MILRTGAQIDALLARAKSVFVVGASAKPGRPSRDVYRYLAAHGFAAYPVNPAYPDVDGAVCYPSIAACAAEHGPPDVVDVFRRAEEADAVAREAVAAGAKAIWFQLGVVNQAAIELADRSGLDVVVDRCMKIEHARTVLR